MASPGGSSAPHGPQPAGAAALPPRVGATSPLASDSSAKIAAQHAAGGMLERAGQNKVSIKAAR